MFGEPVRLQPERSSTSALCMLACDSRLWLTWRAADSVKKILMGAKAGNLPVRQPIRLDLVINANTSKALGMTMRPMPRVGLETIVPKEHQFRFVAD